MIAKANIKLKNASFQFEAEETKDIDALHKVIALTNIRKLCDVCGASGDNFYLTTNKAKGYTFINVKCGECQAKSGLSEYKDGGYYWKDFEKYEAQK